MTSGFPSGTEQLLDAGGYFVMPNELSIVQLRKPFPHFALEPRVMVEIALHNLLDKLLRAATAF